VTELLAKSVRGGRRLTLRQHALDTELAAREIFDSEGRWGRSWCRFFRIPSGPEQARFLLNLRIASLLHDLGKANADFQSAVAGGDALPQALRHEHLGGLALCLPEVHGWLGGAAALDVDGITAAVLSHHLKAGRSGNHAWCEPTGHAVVRLAFADSQLRELLERVQALAGLAAPPSLPAGPWQNAQPWSGAYQRGMTRDVRLKLAFGANPARQSFVAALKAALIVADAVASASFRTERGLVDWVAGVVHSVPARPPPSSHSRRHAVLELAGEFAANDEATGGPRPLLSMPTAIGTESPWIGSASSTSLEGVGALTAGAMSGEGGYAWDAVALQLASSSARY